MDKVEDMTINKDIPRIKEILQTSPVIIAISGPSGAGKDYLTNNAIGYFDSFGINTHNIQMVTERPHRGEVETKICITSEEYDSLQAQDLLIGDHVNGVRYGYRISDFTAAIEATQKDGGLLVLELNPVKQFDFPRELEEKLGIKLTAWVGVSTTTEQTRQNMLERGETAQTIEERVSLIQEFVNSMESNSAIIMCDNGPDNRTNAAQDFINIIKDYTLLIYQLLFRLFKYPKIYTD